MSIKHEITSLLPLRVDRFVATDQFLNFIGENWNVSVNCNWELRRQDGSLISTWESPLESITAAAGDLVGSSVVKVDIDEDIYDPTFIFDSGDALVVEADTDLDPWVFHADGLSVVLVGIGPLDYADLQRNRRS